MCLYMHFPIRTKNIWEELASREINYKIEKLDFLDFIIGNNCHKHRHFTNCRQEKFESISHKNWYQSIYHGGNPQYWFGKNPNVELNTSDFEGFSLNLVMDGG